MLENNRLYRRIQTNNLFKTFTNTYARQTAKLNHQQEFITQNLYRTTIRSCLDQHKIDSQSSCAQRCLSKGETAPTFIRREKTSANENSHYSRTVNISLANTYNGPNSYTSNPYLNTIISKRKDSDSLLWNMKERKTRQNFKLKSCALRERQHYDGHQDETDFSILEWEKQNSLKKLVTVRKKSTLPCFLRLEDRKKKRSTLSTNRGRIPAQIMSRYVAEEDEKSKNMSGSHEC